MKKYKLMLITSILALLTFNVSSCSNSLSKVEGERVEERTLKFYALNDFHGAYLYDEDYEQTGLSRIGNYLKNMKIANPENTFIISSGDMFQGGAESNITYGQVVIETMNDIGFDSMTIGNHEFDWGEDVLKEMEASMDFPLLGINIFYSEDHSKPEYLKDSVVIKKEGINVGIIGAIMPNIGDSILATISEDFSYESSIALIEEEAKRLKEEEDCEIVVLSTHDGNANYYEDLVGDIDALFLGHDHNVRDGYLDNVNNLVPYVEGGDNGNYVSEITLDLKLVNNEYEVVGSSVKNVETFGNETFSYEDREINDIYDKYRENIESIRDQVLYNFDSYVSRNNFARYVSYALLNYASYYDPKILCDGGMVNSGGIRSNIAEGEFTYGDLIKVYPFENTLCILKINEAIYPSFIRNASNLVRSETENNIDGYYYVATIDYVAYSVSTRTYCEEIIEVDVTARDVVAEYLLNEGYSSIN